MGCMCNVKWESREGVSELVISGRRPEGGEGVSPARVSAGGMFLAQRVLCEMEGELARRPRRPKRATPLVRL